jgi:hypothetical protein
MHSFHIHSQHLHKCSTEYLYPCIHFTFIPNICISASQNTTYCETYIPTRIHKIPRQILFMLRLLISTSLKYMLIHKGPYPAQREFRVKKRPKKRCYLDLICLSYSRNISEQLVKRNTSSNTKMRRWSSNPSITNIMMK